MKNISFFSILTASYNSGATINKTLESVRSQSFKNLEHIVIDGGSCDETVDILKDFENTYDLNWISEADRGIADALNKGLHRAQGQYILVVQADDYLLNERILDDVYALLRYDLFDIYCFPVVINRPFQGESITQSIRLLWWHRFRNIFPHQGVFVHRRVFDRIGTFNEKFSISMDYDFFYRALNSRCTVKFEKMPVTLMGGTGISSSDAFLLKRLQEESLVQKLNERNPFWRIAQFFFRLLYFPYKAQMLPTMKEHFVTKRVITDE